MKKLTTSNSVFGPYTTIETLADRYRCDGADLPFVVVGKGVIADVEEGDFPTPSRPLEEVAAEIVAATQQRLDSFAQTRNYDGILSACTYSTSTVEKFATEGQYCVGARDATWAKLYELLAEIEAGDRPVPSGYADIENELPALTWPDQP